MKTAVVYARYSSNSQTEQSIEGQLTVCTQYAKANDLVIVDTYIDRAMTGTNDNRAAFQQMLKDSEHATWDIVLVYAIDRFGRNSIEVAINKQKLKTNGKVLISATQRTSENIDGTKNLDGILLENVYIGIAEYYSAELSQKILRGIRESLNKGQFCGGSIPYGYVVIDKKVYIDDDQAEIVRYIYEEYAKGTTVPKIVDSLNARGLTQKGRHFQGTMIYRILRNEKYIGICKVKENVYTDIFPAILPVELFNRVRLIVEKNRNGKRSVQVDYLLRHKMKCGYCGMPISAECGTSKTGEKKYYYKCLGKKKYRNGCQQDPIRKDVLENYVVSHIVSALMDEAIVDTLVDTLYDRQSRQMEEQAAVNLLTKELRQVEHSLDNIVAAIEKGIVSLTTNKRLHELETRQQELQRQIEIEKAKSIVILSKAELRTYYKEALLLEGKMLINYMVKEITLYNDRVVITFNSPLKTSPDESQGFSFYEEETYMDVVMRNRGTVERHNQLLILAV